MRGFSLVESMMAALLLSVGLLAVAATARSSHRLALLGARTARAAEMAAARLGRLDAAGCDAVAGSAAGGAFAESWTVLASRGLRRIELTVSVAHEGRTLAARYRAAVLCEAELP